MPGKITIAVVFLLTMAVVVFFVFATPENPLESPLEKQVVVGIWGAAVIGVLWVGRALRKKTAAPEGESK